MSTVSFSQLNTYLDSGLLANKLLEVIEIDRKLIENDKEIVERGLIYINNIIDGRKQVKTGKLQNNAVISVNAYTNLLIAVSYSKEKHDPDLEKYLNVVKDELSGVISTNRIISNNVINSKQFFRLVKSYNVDNISKYLYKKNEEKEWQILMK